MAADAPASGGSDDPSGAVVPQGGCRRQAVDGQETGAGNLRAPAAFDGDRNTTWATEWLVSSPPPPRDIQINLGRTYDITGFRYLPRQDGIPQGNIGQYQFCVSSDGVNWGSAAASGTFASGSG